MARIRIDYAGLNYYSKVITAKKALEFAKQIADNAGRLGFISLDLARGDSLILPAEAAQSCAVILVEMSADNEPSEV